MDQSTYTTLTGKTVSSGDTARFELLAKLAKKKLERLLGWPLCPDDWGDQYLESGKKSDECSCPDDDTSELEDPDEVVGAYRLFSWNPLDEYLAIDPATAVHAVKLVRGDVTYKTFETSEYRVHMRNDCEEPYAKYLQLCRDCCSCLTSCLCQNECVQVAVDADWAFETTPLELKKIWADAIAYEFDCNKDVKTESLGSHSYTKFDRGEPSVQFASVLSEYAGPNGSLYRTVRVA